MTVQEITKSHKGDKVSVEAQGTPTPKQKKMIFFYVFCLLLKAMSTNQNTVINESKMLKINADEQTRLNKEDAQIHFSILNGNATTQQINVANNHNQKYSQERADIQSCLITLHQKGQVTMTWTSTDTSVLQQNATQNSAWLGMLNTIYKVINKINQPLY